jgi:hypothetical protein
MDEIFREVAYGKTWKLKRTTVFLRYWAILVVCYTDGTIFVMLKIIKNPQIANRLEDERVTRLELATSTLARLHSTN